MVRSFDGYLILRFGVADAFLGKMNTMPVRSSNTDAQCLHVHRMLVSSMTVVLFVFRLLGIINAVAVFQLTLSSLNKHLLTEINTLLQALGITRYLDIVDVQR